MRADSHYLTCLNENCERAACVDRRNRDQDLKVMAGLLTRVEKDLKKIRKPLNFDLVQIKVDIKKILDDIKRNFRRGRKL